MAWRNFGWYFESQPALLLQNSPVMNADADGQFLAAICAAIGATVVKAVVGAVVGAIVNCASEYVDDVVENYQKGKRGWDMFVPDSPAENMQEQLLAVLLLELVVHHFCGQG